MGWHLDSTVYLLDDLKVVLQAFGLSVLICTIGEMMTFIFPGPLGGSDELVRVKSYCWAQSKGDTVAVINTSRTFLVVQWLKRVLMQGVRV